MHSVDEEALLLLFVSRLDGCFNLKTCRTIEDDPFSPVEYIGGDDGAIMLAETLGYNRSLTELQ